MYIYIYVTFPVKSTCKIFTTAWSTVTLRNFCNALCFGSNRLRLVPYVFLKAIAFFNREFPSMGYPNGWMLYNGKSKEHG